MTKYIGPKTDGANVATQSDVGGSSLSDATPDALTPDQAGAAGTAAAAARADHAHEIICAAAGAILPDDVAAEGTASSFARSDHTHSISAAAPGTITPDASAAEGSSNSFARADHTHAIVAAAPSTNLTASTTNAEGNATSFARSNHTHAIDTAAPSTNLTASTTNATGTSASLSRADHSHAITTGTPGVIQPDDSASAGSSANLARADHTHAIAAASAGTITGTNAEGTSTSFARADHNHAYGALSIPNSALALGPTYETSLPSSPVDGQEIYYAASATDSVIWHLRYRSAARSGSGAWEFLGGPPLYSGPAGDITTASTSYVALSSGPSLTVPRQGIYNVTMELAVAYSRSGSDLSFAGQSYGAGVSINAATPTQFLIGIFVDNFEWDNGAKTIAMTCSTSDALTIRVKADQASEEVRFLAGTLAITPTRVW